MTGYTIPRRSSEFLAMAKRYAFHAQNVDGLTESQRAWWLAGARRLLAFALECRAQEERW